MTLLENNRPLLDAFRRGEEQALRTVYKEYAPRAARYAMSNFNMTAVDVSEVVQTSFIRAFAESARLSYDGVRPYLNFILQVVHNTAINEMKRAWRRHETLPDNADDAWLDALSKSAGEEADRRAILLERQALLVQLHRTLTSEERNVLQKRFVEELSQDAAAEALGLSRQRIRTLERNIRAKAFNVFKSSGFLPAHISGAALLLLVEALLRGAG